MSQNDHTPTFNMKVVVHETGLKPDTLRAWERRYGMPNPQRTPGGHRLYSQYEIDTLKWMVARQADGMSISHAVELWQQLENDGQNPLQTLETAVSDATLPYITGERVDDLRQGWIKACLAFDEFGAQHLVARAFALFPLETVCYQILRRGLSEVGDGWYEGNITVQQEHFASALALRQLDSLLAALPIPTRNGRILVACPPGELHTFAPLMISLMLRRQGWDVVYLGANVPLDSIEASVTDITPLLVILSAQTLTAAANMLPMAQKLQELKIPFAFGGAVFNNVPEAAARIPGHFIGKSLEQVPQAVEKLIHAAPTLPKLAQASPAYEAAYERFVAQRSAIDAFLHASPELSEMPSSALKNINHEMGNNIESALRLGDMTLITANLEWVQGLLLNMHMQLPELPLKQYLAQYHRAAQTILDERAAPILDWFAKLRLGG